MKIDIIIPCHNAEKSILLCVESARRAVGDLGRVIVVDDCSTDGSRALVEGISGIERIFLSINSGAPVARNTGLKAASSAYVLFLDADDYLIEGALPRIMATADESFDVLLAGSQYEAAGSVLEQRFLRAADNAETARNWVAGRFVSPNAVVWRRDYLNAIGGWREGCRRNQDGELMIRGLILGARAVFSTEILGVYVQHERPGRVSRNAGEAVLHQQVDMAMDLLAMTRARHDHRFDEALGRWLYGVATEAYEAGFMRVGNDALRVRRNMGQRRHYGSAIARLASCLVGLQYKVRLARLVRAR